MAIHPPIKFHHHRVRAAIELLLVLVMGLFIYGWKLGDAPLDRTEPHRALVAHQMVTSGDWFIPKLFGEIYLRKPPLIYWIEGGTEKLIGHGDEFVWRLPSAIGSALLAVILAEWSARWFGAFARLPAGIACLALVPLWEQDRGADIDAINTLASVITAMVVIEMLYARGRERPGKIASTFSSCAAGGGSPGFRDVDEGRAGLPPPAIKEIIGATEMPAFAGWSSVIWPCALSFSLAATLLLKGPGGFPPVLGALIGPSLLLRDWKWVRRPGVWIGLLVGIAIFAAYGVAAKTMLRHQGIAADNRGIAEAMQRLVIHKFSAIVPAVIAPVTTLLYAVPVSVAIAFSVILMRRSAGETPVVRRQIIALQGTIGAALVIWILAGNDNPRYEYVALPMLAPLVGAVAVAWCDGKFTDAQQSVLRFVLIAFGVLWAGLAVVIAFATKNADKRIAIRMLSSTSAGAAVVAVVAALFAIVLWSSKRYRLGAFAITLVLVCLAVPLGERKNLERQKKSARAAAVELREIVHDQPIGIVSMNRDMPELFYYANLPAVKTYGENGLAKLAAAPGGQWVVLSQNKTFPEYRTLTSQIPTAFPHGVTRLHMPDDRDIVYVGWYDPPPGVSRILKAPMAPAPAEQSDED